MRKILNKYFFKPDLNKRGEVPGGECLVDPKGYIPMNKQIQLALSAGERLEAFRKEYYGSPDPNYFNPDDINSLNSPGVLPSVDIPIEAERLQNKYEQRLKQAVEAQKAKIQKEESPNNPPTEP